MTPSGTTTSAFTPAGDSTDDSSKSRSAADLRSIRLMGFLGMLLKAVGHQRNGLAIGEVNARQLNRKVSNAFYFASLV